MTPIDLLARARSAIDHGITYANGAGGLHPTDPLPTRTRTCDCSGNVAWVVGRSRNPATAPKLPKWPWWLSTDSIYDDATGPQIIFYRIPEAIPGCIAVYADWRDPQGKKHEGHTGIVADPAKRTVVDCSSSQNGIAEHVQNVFWGGKRPVVFCLPRGVA